MPDVVGPPATTGKRGNMRGNLTLATLLFGALSAFAQNEFREDGRVYSVALIVNATGKGEIPVGAKVVAQGKISHFGQAATRFGPGLFAVIQDEQQSAKTLMCAIRGKEEAAEAGSLYHVGVVGEYLMTASIAGEPPMPALYDCFMAGPQKDVVRPSTVADLPTPNTETGVAAANHESVLDRLDKEGNANVVTAPKPEKQAETDALMAGKVYKVAGGVRAPRAIYAPDPDYSDAARKANFGGTVVLWLIVGPDGKPRDIKVARALGMGLDEKAIEAVQQWKFDPAIKDGNPVAVQINVEVSFRTYAIPGQRPPTFVPQDWHVTDNGNRITGEGWVQEVQRGLLIISNLRRTGQVTCTYNKPSYKPPYVGDKISVSLKRYKDGYKCDKVIDMTR